MKILLLDIETAPNLGYTWGKWEQDVIEFKEDWYILCFVAKWLDSKKLLIHKLPDFPRFRKNKTDDKMLVKELWKLMDEADVIIAHNGNSFDIKKANARFIAHGLKSPSPYKTIDTKLVAKKYFKFDSNKLDELGRYLRIGRKVHHEGFALWLKCMAGEKKAWKTMINYNIQDVLLLEKIYLKLRGWMTNHPNSNLFEDTNRNCPNCGSHKLQLRGRRRNLSGAYQQYQCQECGGWSRSLLVEKKKVVIR